MPQLKVDLHVHTHYSTKDGFSSPKEIALKAKKLKFDVIGITDHITTKGGLETKKLARSLAPKLLVLVGQEAKTNHGDFIVFGPKTDYPKDVDLVAMAAVVKRQGGFTIAPHPFDRLRSGIGNAINDVLEYLDAMESFNGRTYAARYNRKAEAFAKEYNIPAIASSDSHHIREFGQTYTLIESQKNLKSIFSAIKAGKTKLVKEKTSFSTHFRATLTKKFLAGKN